MTLNIKLMKDLLLAMNEIYNESDGPVGMSDNAFFSKFGNMDSGISSKNMVKDPANDYSDMVKKFTDDDDNFNRYAERPGYINGGIPSTIRARMQMEATPEPPQIQAPPKSKYEETIDELPELPSL